MQSGPILLEGQVLLVNGLNERTTRREVRLARTMRLRTPMRLKDQRVEPNRSQTYASEEGAMCSVETSQRNLWWRLAPCSLQRAKGSYDQERDDASQHE